MYAWHDSWTVDDGLGVNLACELNELVIVKVAWKRDELRSYEHGWVMMSRNELDLETWKLLALKGDIMNIFLHGEYLFTLWSCFVRVSA